MALKQLYQDIYQKFLERKDTYKGYNFQEAPYGSTAPPIPTFAEKLKAWTFNRPSRLKKIRALRDQRQQEIINLKSPPSADK
ncbi:MAG: hypothetical protein AB7P17_03805 [Nitrospirales bacterium]|nr:hypothetical protein [Nitrospirales bacterium]